MKASKWFCEKFLPAFRDGETRISEKQYEVFCRNLPDVFERGCTVNHVGEVNGKRVTAYEWASIAGTRFYVHIEAAR